MGQAQSPRSPDGGTTRCIAIIGPYLSGKTTLLEAILARTGTIPKQGQVQAGSTIGDASDEARTHGMSVELNVASTEFLGDRFVFVDCPGSVEFQHEADPLLSICDAAVVVCEPDPKRVPALQLILKRLEENKIPHFLFLNKVDSSTTPVRDLIPVLQPASALPLVLRQIPIWENGIASGFVDLALERAFVYREHAPSEIVDMPSGITERRQDARFHMLEQLADYDDELMEQLLSDIDPPRDRVFDDLAKELQDGRICPVLLGAAANGNGVLRLMKALRHEVPNVSETARRIGVSEDTSANAYVVKSIHTSHAGKVSLARVLTGSFDDGDQIVCSRGNSKISGVYELFGAETRKGKCGSQGDLVGFGKLDCVNTGETITTAKNVNVQLPAVDPPPAVYSTALGVKDRKDEVKLTTSITKLSEEDPGLRFDHDEATHQILLHGQGEMHLRVATERLERKYGIHVDRAKPQTQYKETIRKAVTVRAKHKKQSGGHGQYGDVVLEIRPQPRGAGFSFSDTIVGGAIPKQFIPSVEAGVRDYLQKGPLGFEVVDVAVTLTDGSFHSVDSSDMAFRQAGRLAMSKGMPDCDPVLLEPVMSVDVFVPTETTARINGIISQRRGQILGFDGREGWPGWDIVNAQMPASEIDDLIIELRSATAGVGSYTSDFDHLAVLSGRLADRVLAAQNEAAA